MLIYNDVLAELSTLADKLCEKCGNLYESKELLGETLYLEILDNYLEIYKKEYDILLKRAEINYKNKEFELKVKKNNLVPRNYGFLWLKKNLAKQIALREQNAEIKNDFMLRELAVETEEEKLKSAETEEPSTGSPSETEPTESDRVDLISKEKPTTSAACTSPETEKPEISEKKIKPKRREIKRVTNLEITENQLEGQMNINDLK